MGQWVQILKLVTQPKTQRVWLVRFGFDQTQKLLNPNLCSLDWFRSIRIHGWLALAYTPIINLSKSTHLSAQLDPLRDLFLLRSVRLLWLRSFDVSLSLSISISLPCYYSEPQRRQCHNMPPISSHVTSLTTTHNEKCYCGKVMKGGATCSIVKSLSSRGRGIVVAIQQLPNLIRHHHLSVLQLSLVNSF